MVQYNAQGNKLYYIKNIQMYSICFFLKNFIIFVLHIKKTNLKKENKYLNVLYQRFKYTLLFTVCFGV